MKLLHSKATAEPIVAVAACPCANLFGLVTQSTVAVYRHTTLTTVFNFSLKSFHTAQRGGDDAARGGQGGQGSSAWCCCWSPSGRLLSVALPSGLLLILDVECGALVRLLAPRGTAALENETLPTPTTTTVTTATSGSALAGTWRASTTLPPGQPVLAMCWCAVPSLSADLVDAMHAEVRSRCLPVRTGPTAALLDEVVQGSGVPLHDAATQDSFAATLPGSSSGVSHAAAARRSSAAVALLLVLGADGVLRCLVGGLCESQRLTLTSPSPQRGSGSSGGMSSPPGWTSVVVEDLQLQQRAVPDVPGGAVMCASASAQETADPLRWARFGATAAEGVRRAARQHHQLYMTVSATSTTHGDGGGPAHALWEVDLRGHLAVLATSHCLALSYVREYTGIAYDVYERVARDWRAVMQGRLWLHLGLPAAAPLLSSALVAHLTEPHPLALYTYATQQLQRTAVAADLEAMAAVLRRATQELTLISYRCCEAAMQYAVHIRAPAADVVGTVGTIMEQLGALRRRCEALLRRATHESEVSRDMVLWVLQESHHWAHRSRFSVGAAGEDYTEAEAATTRGVMAEEDVREPPLSVDVAAADRARSPSPQPPPAAVVVDEVPLSASRQPAVLAYLSSMSTPEADTHGAAAAQLCERIIAAVEACGTASCASVAAGPANSSLQARVVMEAAVRDPRDAVTAAQLLCCVVDSAEATDGSASEEGSSAAGGGADAPSLDRGHPRCETGLEMGLDEEEEEACSDVWLSGGGGGGAAAAAAAAALVADRTHVYMLQQSPTAATDVLGALQMRSLHLRSPDAVATATRVVDDDASVTAVDAGLLRARLSAQPATPYEAAWYGYLAEDRHVLVFMPGTATAAAGRGAAGAAPLLIAIVDGDGRLVTAEEEEDDDDDDEGDGGAVACESTRAAVCEVAGMESAVVRVSMSRARSFCVVAGVNKYVVLSLYDDEY
ncbi:hypothetical protein NESM_000331100 [Novymonas esmeraldas]|uniref:Anaphase-promoting complex subunit 4 n=1 Tax=Novymonas esmeraldas TaxID=1808958 RepID=A0AAW0EJ53_9TRYP